MIADDKTRILVTVTKEVKAELDKLAADEIRTTSNFCATIFNDYLKNRNK